MIKANEIKDRIVKILTGQEFPDPETGSNITSTVVIDYCQSEFGKPLTVYTGIDYQNPPTEENCPLISIQKLSHTGVGQNSTETEFIFEIVCSIVKEDITTTEDDDFNLIEHDGEAEATDFIYLIHEELKKYLPDSLQLSDEDLAFPGSILYPMFEAYMSLHIKVVRSLGGFEPTL